MPQVQVRACDGCTACCIAPNIPETESPCFQPCRHIEDGKGCGIYPDRPRRCALFLCDWALGTAPEWMRPNVCGILPMRTSGQAALHLYELWPEASRTEAIQAHIRQANEQGVHVVVTSHPGPSLTPILRNRAYLANGEQQDFEGLEFRSG